jgi:nitrite reductase (NO-forming)
VLFGVIWGIDAFLKWRPGYRHSYLDNLKQAAQGQPHWLHDWFHFWINLQAGSPLLWATLTGIAETVLALVLLLGVARRAGYIIGSLYALLIWSVAEGFGGPYDAGSTDIGTGIVYVMMFITLLAFAPPARRERLSLDRLLVERLGWWRWLAEPHAVDRVPGGPRVEPVVVGEITVSPADENDPDSAQAFGAPALRHTDGDNDPAANRR